MEKDTSKQVKLVGMIQGIRFAMLTTASPDGTIHSRPMYPLAANFRSFDGTLWFFSKRDSQKNHEIETDQHVNLAYADPDRERYVSISGVAFVSTDQAKMEELWDPIVKVWFPEGLKDPQISLIGVRVETAEIWDSPPGSPNEQRSQGQHIELRQ